MINGESAKYADTGRTDRTAPVCVTRFNSI
jgi:hypothetical protein|nr:MAG TPA: hypothetical protein [Bacteriophage sp.]